MSTKRRIAFHPATKISTGRISKAQLAGLSEPDDEFERQVAAIAGTTVGTAAHGNSASSPAATASHALLPLDARAVAVGLPPPELHLCPESAVAALSHTTWQGPPRGVGAGLYNLGNTCFLNATLQCLAYCPPLAQLLDDSNDNDDGGVDRSRSQQDGGASARAALWGEGGGGQTFNVVKLLRELFGRLRGNENTNSSSGKKPAEKTVSPKAMVASLRALGRQFRVGRQEDAHEFLCHLLDGLHKHCLRSQGLRPHDPSLLASRVGDTSLVHRLFGGHLRSRLMCSTCRETSDKFEPFLDLSLHVKSSGAAAAASGGGGGHKAKANGNGSHGHSNSGKADTIEAALERYTRGEVLEGDNQWECPRCRTRRNATKSLAIFRAPTVLCLQLKRFSFGRAFAGRKISAPVAFPEQLNLPIAELDTTNDDAVSGGSSAAAASTTANNGAVAKAAAAKSRGKVVSEPGQKKGNSSSAGSKLFVGYNLTGVLVHRGESVHSGHYYAFAKARNGVWHRFDDSEVYPVSLKVVLDQPAYLLFYTANGKDSRNSSGGHRGGVNSSSSSDGVQTTASVGLSTDGFEDKEDAAEASEEELGESVKPSKVLKKTSSAQSAAPPATIIAPLTSLPSSSSTSVAANWMSSSFAAANARAEPDVPLLLRRDDDDDDESDFNGAEVAAAAQRFVASQQVQNGLPCEGRGEAAATSSSRPSSSSSQQHLSTNKLALDGWAVSFSASGCGSRRFKPLHSWVRLPKPLWLLARDSARSQDDYTTENGRSATESSHSSSGGFKRSRSLQAEVAAAWRPPPSASPPAASSSTSAPRDAPKSAAPLVSKVAPSAVASARGFATVDFAAENAKLRSEELASKKRVKKAKKQEQVAPPPGLKIGNDHDETNDATDVSGHNYSSDQESGSVATSTGWPALAEAAVADKPSDEPNSSLQNNKFASVAPSAAGGDRQRRPESLDPKRGFVSVANQPRGVKTLSTAGGKSARGFSAADAAAALPAWEAEDGDENGQGLSEQELAEAKRQRFLNSGPRAKDPKTLPGKKQKPRYDMWDALLDAGKSKKVGKAARKREAAEAAVKAQARGENPFERAGQVKIKAAKKQQAAEVAAAKAAIKHSTDI